MHFVVIVYTPSHDVFCLQEVSLGEGDTAYLRRELGSVLAAALAAVVELQPSDPVDMLALWLLKFRVSGCSASDTLYKIVWRPTCVKSTQL